MDASRVSDGTGTDGTGTDGTGTDGTGTDGTVIRAGTDGTGAGRTGLPDRVVARPRRLLVASVVTAVVLVAIFVALALSLGPRTEGGGYFTIADQVAMVGLGVLLAAGALAFARPKVEADIEGVHVRNIVGGYRLPWAVVRAVRFTEHSPWASLELADDDTVPVMAVQAADGDHALVAVRGLRRLLADARAAAAVPPADAPPAAPPTPPGSS